MLTKSLRKSRLISPVIKFLLTPIAMLFLLFGLNANAKASEAPRFGFFVTHEVNDRDHISSIGTEVWLTSRHSNFGASFLTSIGKAEVTGRDNKRHDYVAWDAGFKLGYFSDVFAYAEFGFDLGELALHDRDERDRDNLRITGDDFVVANRTRYDNDNNIDGYIGIGGGMRFGNIQIEAFSKRRQVDGEHWKADNQTFMGAKVSVVF